MVCDMAVVEKPLQAKQYVRFGPWSYSYVMPCRVLVLLNIYYAYIEKNKPCGFGYSPLSCAVCSCNISCTNLNQIKRIPEHNTPINIKNVDIIANSLPRLVTCCLYNKCSLLGLHQHILHDRTEPNPEGNIVFFKFWF